VACKLARKPEEGATGIISDFKEFSSIVLGVFYKLSLPPISHSVTYKYPSDSSYILNYIVV
jgi:hypothetical protein